MTDEEPFGRHATAFAADIRTSAAFLTSIPVSAFGAASELRLDFRRAAQVFPIVGALIGVGGGLVVVLGSFLGLPAYVTATLAITAIVGLTGALHEDGLSDTADGFGGGSTIARKLEIMGDSRIGSFGATALILSLLLRVTALAALVPAGELSAPAALIAAEAASRGAMVRLWHDLPTARPDGMASQAGPPDDRATLGAMIFSALIVLLAIVPIFGALAALVGTAILIAATFICAKLFTFQIGGQTGDTLGACQQCTSIAFLVCMTLFV